MSAARFHRRPLSLATLLAIPMLVTLGSTAAVTAQDAERDAELAERRAELDARFVIGPTAAREMGYRIGWQTTISAPIHRFDVFAGDVYTADTDNHITRVDRANGSQVWSITANDPNDHIWGITPGMPPHDGLPWGQNASDRLYVTTDPVVFEIDHATGAILGRQDLEKVPSTDVIRFGSYLVFGTRMGQIVWHQYLVGQEWRANQLLGPIVATPTVVGNSNIAVASQGGTVLLLDAKSAGRIWGENVFDGVTTSPTAGGGYVFLAGKDQYLWAFDARNGRVAWRYFTESPLDTSPIHVPTTNAEGGVVLQWVETEGLVCLAANPGDTIEGKVLWRLPEARGEGLGIVAGDRVAIWDGDARVLRIVDVANGAVAKTIDLPQVSQIRMVGDSIYATGDDGRLSRLDPVR
jgi:outer membrane protein assembly factor BamB